LLWLLTQFLKIAFLTAKPYEIPGDQATLRLAIVASFVTHVVAIWGIYDSPMVIGQALLDLALSGSVLFVALSMVGKSARFNQAFASLCGANTVINLASMPVIFTRLASELPSGVNGDSPPVIDLVGFFFLVWSISVIAHVIRFSFDTNIPVSIVASVGYIILALTVYEIVFSL